MTLRRATFHGFELLVLSSTDASVEVCPARGGLVTRFNARGDDVLFLDEATFADATKNVRGGVPILFPVAGPPPAGSPLKQHGFARTSAWDVVRATDDEVTLALRSNDATRALFPFDFQVDSQLRLDGAQLVLAWTVRNTGAAPMPLHFGLHPYFRVPLDGKAKARVDTDATRAWDNRAKALGARPSLDFGGDEIDLHLLDHSEPRTTLHRGDGSSVRLAWSSTFDTLVLWTLPGQAFVCVEPWSGPAASVLDGRPRMTLPPGAAAYFELRVG
ncbi:MAG: aldose epimerase [Myxococcales bacterium]|nr:aldose epimerase [Myxococcales bacterium]